MYAHTIARDLVNDGLPHAGREEVLNIFAYWLKAMAQHYGAGSEYLDVTHDLEIAVWFALHKAETSEIGGMFGNNPEQNFPFKFQSIRYRSIENDEKGYLYVLDAPGSEGDTESPVHFVDVGAAPEPFSSPRVKAQSACLITPTAGGTDWEAKKLCACDPIEINLPMKDSIKAHSRVPDLFPPPSVDPWYDRFLSLPNVLHVEKDKAYFGPPIPMDIYISEPADFHTFQEKHFALNPPFLFTIDQIRREKIGKLWNSRKLRDAIPIYLEGPILSGAPSPDSGLWNQELLLSGLPSRATFEDLVTGKTTSGLNLDNLFFEVSPLETVSWNRPQQKLLRAVWFVRDEGQFLMKLYFQILPVGTIIISEVMRIGFDPSVGKFRQIRGNQFAEIPVSILKQFLMIMLLLRELLNDWKILPFPVFVLDEHTYVVRGTDRAAAKLVRSPLSYFVVRETSSDAPYVVPGVYPTGVDCKIESDKPFSQVPVGTIKEKFLHEIMRSGSGVRVGPLFIRG